MRHETRDVLAEAYKRESSFLTHVVEVDSDDRDVAVLCKRVEIDSIADRYSLSEAERAAAATCPACARRDPRKR